MTVISDPEILKFIRISRTFVASEDTIAAERRAYDAMCDALRAPRPPGVAVTDVHMAGIPVRRYRPAGGGRAICLYLHGGGFAVGGLDSHDDICAELADRTGAEVICPDYRLAPEHPHPAALEDVVAVWSALGPGGPKIVAGDSAGGNLAVALCLRLSHTETPKPDAMALVYPGLGGPPGLPSRRLHAGAPLLSADDIAHYDTLRGANPHDPEASPLAADDLSVLPPALVLTADVDPLRDDGALLVRRMIAEGRPAEWRNEPQLVHGYLRARHCSARAAASFSALTDWVAE